MTTYKDLTAAFQAADDAWQAELVRTFGKNAGDVRYTRFAHGETGTPLRAAWDKRDAAEKAWSNARQFV